MLTEATWWSSGRCISQFMRRPRTKMLRDPRLVDFRPVHGANTVRS